MIPSASYTYTLNARTVSFTDTSSNSPTSWDWDFGDGTTSTQRNPSKTFTADGSFNVRLTATNSAGSNSYACSITVNSQSGATSATVTYDTDGGVAIAATPTTVGSSITLPAATKTNATFTGWYTGSTFVGNPGSAYTVTGNVTLTAHWSTASVTKYTVTFFGKDGAAIATQDVVSGGKATDPGAPSGGKFTGWYTSTGMAYSFSTPVTSNLNLYAHFEAQNIWDNELIMYAVVGAVVILLIIAIARTI